MVNKKKEPISCVRVGWKISVPDLGLLRVSEYSDIRGSEYKIGYGYSSLPKSLDRDLFFFFFLPFF